MSKKDRFKCANLIRSCLLKHYGLSLSTRRVRHRLNEGGLFGRSPQKKLFISLHNRCRRLEWARQHAHFSVEDWKNMLFSNESKFVRVHSSSRCAAAVVTWWGTHGGGSTFYQIHQAHGANGKQLCHDLELFLLARGWAHGQIGGKDECCKIWAARQKYCQSIHKKDHRQKDHFSTE